MEPTGERPILLIIKGSFAQFGGAERDIVRQLEAWGEFFDLRIATLNSHSELEKEANRLEIPLFIADPTWEESTSALSRVLASSSKSSTKAWKKFLTLGAGPGTLNHALESVDAVHLVTGSGSLEAVSILPEHIPIHVHMLEPNRGLHGETVLWANINGKQPRPVGLTRLLLTIPRRRDLKLVNKIALRSNAVFSGNSNYIQQRIKEVHKIDAGVLLPCVDLSKWSSEEQNTPENYVVSIGHASWVKGTWECISMLANTGIKLVHVGGGSQDDLSKLKEHATKLGVEFDISPRLDHESLVSLLRYSLAVISMAHKEPFGLTPAEAHAVGTPALMVNEGGFPTTIIDGESGRLLPRDDYSAWHSALKEAAIVENRMKWSERGRGIVEELSLDPKGRAVALRQILGKLIQ
ncbi:MAG: glycosyltransferase [Candidatus Thalassarchaeaceae archaeon]|jgi:glycosyltransferase involved in cell wall biosynthesis|nr:glycosyltransferase [Candidatus Thalassarchaeaceae archaeon]